ncbi:hypothetical protein [Microbacterium sp. SA39]|uniref:hypothetical protein n=1 Tax=Microbacterium sp. SA39 TaxID=1263625 RepID=UPI0005F9C708|nr:hypothetical protein [Microbacterium sp. SA39]KJQ54664.1 hypothetical protein RS85_01393 [Microbacterium sp. SA39]
MIERPCIRGCTVPGLHYAACESYGRSDGLCTGCVTAASRDDALVCGRCYGRLHRTLDRAPELVEHVRTLTGNVSAKRYDSEVSHGAAAHTRAPASADMLDAYRDVMATIGVSHLATLVTPESARTAAEGAVRELLAHFDQIANDADSFAQWWQIVVAQEVPTHPEFWTISRVLARWPLQDRRRWASAPCPACDLMSVSITPPARPLAPVWYSCTSCDWERNDRDDEGLWEALFGTREAS